MVPNSANSCPRVGYFRCRPNVWLSGPSHWKFGVLSSPIVARLMQNFNIKGYPLLMLMMSTTLTQYFCLLLDNKEWYNCLIFLGLASYFVTIPLPQLAVTLQTISPNKMRGMVAGIFVVTGNVMGMGLGPTFVAFFTENIFRIP